MKTNHINQAAILLSSKQKVYEAMLGEKIHTAFTGAEANIDRNVNGNLDVYGGYSH